MAGTNPDAMIVTHASKMRNANGVGHKSSSQDEDDEASEPMELISLSIRVCYLGLPTLSEIEDKVAEDFPVIPFEIRKVERRHLPLNGDFTEVNLVEVDR